MTVSQGDMILFDSLLGRSNLPVQEKSYLRKWVDRMTGGALESAIQLHSDSRPETKLEAALATLRQGSEGIMTGAMLGALSAHDALEPFGVPVDGAGGALLTVLGVFAAGHEASKDARNTGIAGMTVYSFRKVDKLLRVMGAHMAGEDDVNDIDPNASNVINTEASMAGSNVGKETSDIVEFAKTL
jgi:hypothetical protein